MEQKKDIDEVSRAEITAQKPAEEKRQPATEKMRQEEAESRLKQLRPIINQILLLYDKFDFQYVRFSDKEAVPIKKENQSGFFENLLDFIEKESCKYGVDYLSLLVLLSRNALASILSEDGLSNEQLRNMFLELLVLLEGVARRYSSKFMELTEDNEQLVNCIAVETADQNRIEVVRRGLIYKDNICREYEIPIRYQEIKIYKKN